MKRFFFFSCFLLGILLPSLCLAEDLSSVDMLGVRIGFWSAPEAKNVETDLFWEEVPVTERYLELFLSSGLKKRFSREISLGLYWRGETELYDIDPKTRIKYTLYYHKVVLLPISLGFKFYPLSPVKNSRWHPYIGAGVGLVLGIEKYYSEYWGNYSNISPTFGWHVGGGIEFKLSQSIVIGADFKYRGVNFREEIGGLKDYSGPGATLGLYRILK